MNHHCPWLSTHHGVASLCTGHLPTDDGPDPHPLWWSDWHLRWCSCSWKGWQVTWQMSPWIHESPVNKGLSSTRISVLSNRPPSCFWMCLWCQWSSSWPWKAQDSLQDASTCDSNSTTEVPWIGNLPVTLHTLTLLLHCTPTWAAEEWNRVHLELLLSWSIWQSQINGLQG